MLRTHRKQLEGSLIRTCYLVASWRFIGNDNYSVHMQPIQYKIGLYENRRTSDKQIQLVVTINYDSITIYRDNGRCGTDVKTIPFLEDKVIEDIVDEIISYIDKYEAELSSATSVPIYLSVRRNDIHAQTHTCHPRKARR